MNDGGKSDKAVVPKKPPNNCCGAPQLAEEVEERALAEGNPRQQNRSRAQNREDLQSALNRIRQVASEDRKMRFTTLWHHVYNVDRLQEAYLSLKKKASAGIDGVTWAQYGEDLEGNLQDLSDRLRRGAYRAKPVRRVFIDKADGRKRPLGVPVLEDKIVQRSTVEVLNAVYEVDFMGFSYGARPRRGAHNALDAVAVGIEKRKVNWVLDADIRGFYDAINHEWLIRFVEHRIADKRVIRHIKKWLNAGVLEDGRRMRSEEGSPQGSSVSPLLANIYLHYVFDLWIQQWRRKESHGNVIVVRYMDDIIVGFQHKSEALQFLGEMRKRFSKFNLELHPEKTRLIRFGRFAEEDTRNKDGGRKPETFDFLGFTHVSFKKRNGKFMVLRRTKRKRLGAKLKEVKQELRRRMHEPVPVVGKWLASVVVGHAQYFGVPFNRRAIDTFRTEVIKLWHSTLKRRSQNDRTKWERVSRLANRYIPKVRISHPYPNQRLCV
jgi:RNA-directed DNA polymerase